MKGDFNNSVSSALNGTDTIFSRLKGKATRYIYQDDIGKLDRYLEDVATGRYHLEVLEAHCLDRLQHWWLDDEKKMLHYYRKFDDFIHQLHKKCVANDVCFMLISDHGMEPVQHSIDLSDALIGSGVPTDSYEVFIEPSKATFWIHDWTKAGPLQAELQNLDGGEVLTRKDLRTFGLDFEDGSYGDMYFYARPGYSIFPNDFYHPIANFVQGLLDWQQRPRISKPCHKGEHGYLPDNECEAGLLILANTRERMPARVSLVDIAPRIMDLVQNSKLG